MNVTESLRTGIGVTLSEALSFGGMTTFLGLAIVFAVLVVLMIVLYLFKVVFYKDPGKQKTKPESEEPTVTAAEKEDSNINEDELIAVLTAAVAASLNTSTYNLQIKSYRRVDEKRPAWNRAGLNETIGNRF